MSELFALCRLRITVRAVYESGESSDSNPIVASIAAPKDRGREGGTKEDVKERKGRESEEEKEEREKLSSKAPTVFHSSSPPLPLAETQSSGPAEKFGGRPPDQISQPDPPVASTVDKQTQGEEVGEQGGRLSPSLGKRPDPPQQHPELPGGERQYFPVALKPCEGRRERGREREREREGREPTQ